MEAGWVVLGTQYSGMGSMYLPMNGLIEVCKRKIEHP